MTAKNLLDFFNKSSSYISARELAKLFPIITNRFETDIFPIPNNQIGYMGMIDIKTFLEGEVLTKVDRATMQVALEGREPFLDQNIIEFGLSLPDELKIKGKQTKYIIRKILYKYVPKELIERPKQGFDIPMRSWTNDFLKNDLKAMSKDCNFLNSFGFNKIAFNEILKNYFQNKSAIDPHFVWYLFVLFKWHNKWL